MEMKKYLLALLCANFLGAAWAAEDEAPAADAPAAKAATTQAPTATQAPAQFGATGMILPDGAACDGGSCCPACTKKVCCPEPTTKKITKTLYRCKCEDYCLPCLNLDHLFSCDPCPACETGKCGCVRTKKVLNIRTCTEECHTYKCVPKEVPAEPKCRHSWFGFGHKDYDAEVIGQDLPPAPVVSPGTPVGITPGPEMITAPRPNK
jgi:hypothetical protein